ncbi:unnamed protein product [Soboliphyme baturini]|uniref:Helitron_like_N domain-containing protein n=1 Tax=Soboliphyme baturini TaxID=241478 RepID=A0A183IY38_9BILA|nr:unnamed protein product [Soboliphyme baturini]
MGDTKRMMFQGLARHSYNRMLEIRLLPCNQRNRRISTWRENFPFEQLEDFNDENSMEVFGEQDFFYLEARQQWLLNRNLFTNKFSIVAVVPLRSRWNVNSEVMMPSEISVLTFTMYDGIKSHYRVVFNSTLTVNDNDKVTNAEVMRADISCVRKVKEDFTRGMLRNPATTSKIYKLIVKKCRDEDTNRLYCLYADFVSVKKAVKFLAESSGYFLCLVLL